MPDRSSVGGPLRNAACLCFVTACMLATKAQATATVFLELPASPPIVGELFDVQIVANLPNAVLGWGLDFEIAMSDVAATTGVEIGGSWLSIATADGDGLGGVAFPDPVSDQHVVLATISLEALAEGTTELILSDNHLTDLTEGFALEPDGFESVEYVSSNLTVIPEPSVISLLAGLTFIAGVCRERRLRRQSI